MRIASLDILLTTEGNDFLKEEYGKVIENIQVTGTSNRIKNKDLSGTPTAGSVEAKRFVNRKSNAYGTARSGGAGQAVKAKPVTVKIDVDRELITEIEQKDVSLYGVDNFVQRQASMDEKSMNRELETSFWGKVTDGTKVEVQATEADEIAEELIQSLVNVKNDFVDGVPRDMITLSCTTAFYGKLRKYMDKVNDGTADKANFGMFHGVRCEENLYLPADVKTAVAIADGSIAQPVLPTITPAQRVPLSNAIATGLFYSYGTETVAEDLIFYA